MGSRSRCSREGTRDHKEDILKFANQASYFITGDNHSSNSQSTLNLPIQHYAICETCVFIRITVHDFVLHKDKSERTPVSESETN